MVMANCCVVFAPVVGDAVPIAACLDLHANVSEQMVAESSLLEAYRTYPHVDMSETGARSADLLDLLLRHGLARFPAVAARRTDFLIPPVFGCTLVDPARAIYEHLRELDSGRGCRTVAGLRIPAFRCA